MLGSTGYENMTVTLEFEADGVAWLQTIREDGVEMGRAEALVVWYNLDGAERKRLEGECWEDACLSEQVAS